MKCDQSIRDRPPGLEKLRAGGRQQLNLLGHDQIRYFRKADEAFRDVLKKYGRPIDLKDALRRSAGDVTGHQLHLTSRKKPPRK